MSTGAWDPEARYLEAMRRTTWTAVGGFAGMGALALAVPSAIPRMFGAQMPTAASRNEVRAVYGGFGIAVATLLAATAHDPTARTWVHRVAGVSLLGMAAGRLVDLALSADRPGFWPVGPVLAGETALGAALLVPER